MRMFEHFILIVRIYVKNYTFLSKVQKSLILRYHLWQISTKMFKNIAHFELIWRSLMSISELLSGHV